MKHFMKIALRIQLFLMLMFALNSFGQIRGSKDLPPVKYDSIFAKDTTVMILWRGNRYDTTYKDSVNAVLINNAYCKTISDPVRAALGYVATFVGSDCWWDGPAKDDRSNLKCEMLSALDLGYQCSDRHLGFLRKWFKYDTLSLKNLKDCGTVPYTATYQDAFDEIRLTLKGNTITVKFRASYIDTRDQGNWSYTETNIFEYDKNGIVLTKVIRPITK